MLSPHDVDGSVLETIRELPGIAVLVIFGSRAANTHRAESDLDVGILTTSNDAVDRRHLVSRLAAALADLSPGGRVDIVLIDEAPALLRQRIMEKGRVILCKEPALWRELRIRTMREFEDTEHVRRMMRLAQRRRLEGGDPGGRSGRAIGSLERIGRLPH